MSMIRQPFRQTRPYAVAARDVQPLAELAAASGVSLDGMLPALGIKGGILADEEAAIGLGDYFRLLERLSQATQDETCHLSSRPLLPGSTHFAWSSVADAPNLLEAMKRVAKAYNMLHGGYYNHVELRENSVAYIIDDRAFPYNMREDIDYLYFTLECVLIFLHGTLMLVAGDRLQRHLRKVYSRRPRRVRRNLQLDFLGTAIRWNAPYYALIYDLPAAFLPVQASVADLPPSDAVYRKLIDLIEMGGPGAPPLADRVADMLRQGYPSQQAVAVKLAMSVATMRRRLEAEGVSFRGLHHRVMADAAKAMLRQDMRSAEVADALGFADFRSFSRAFKSWTGATPTAWRGQQLEKKD